MLGVDWSRCTALHLAEYEQDYPGRRCGSWPIPIAGGTGTRWRDADELLVWEGDFNAIANGFAASFPDAVASLRLGAADCHLVRLRDIVEFTVALLPGNRDLRRYGVPPGWTHVREAPERLAVRPLLNGDQRR